MTVDFVPWIAALGLFVLASGLGLRMIRKIVTVYEAKHELKQGSAGWIRSISGWSMIAFWALATWFLSTIIGDWAVSGDLGAAVDRSWLRLRILLEIAAAIADSD